ncbi:MAG: YceI family protein [Bacteroidetes bacterium]|nr:YceI family protein [Bacteroidota bacterium]
MKKGIFIIAILVTAAIFGCKGPEGQKVTSGEAAEPGNDKSGASIVYAADTVQSVIEWLGTKPTGEHYGTIFLSSGKLMVEDGSLVGGDFVIDMKSIENEDVQDPEYNQKLVDHLKSADFFEVEMYPVSRFVITGVEKVDAGSVKDSEFRPTHRITGNLSMKDVTRSITFDAVVSMKGDEVIAYTPQFVIDRSEWNIKYGSRKFFDNLKDNFIYDEIGLKIKLIGKK